jgi:hypothetical protein
MARIEFKIKQGVTYDELYDKLNKLNLISGDEILDDDEMHIDMSTSVWIGAMSKELQEKMTKTLVEDWEFGSEEDIYDEEDNLIEEEDSRWRDLVVRLHEMFMIDEETGEGYYVDGQYQIYVIGQYSDDDLWLQEDDSYESDLFKGIKEKLSTIKEIEIV